MRKTLLVGLVLMVAAVLVVIASAGFDLDLEPIAVLGVALGAVAALVPDRTPTLRLAGFAGGVVAAWIGYLLRAAVLPDSTAGRAVAVVVVLGIAVAIAAATLDRVPLWSTLLGAAALTGAYEHSYAAAPPEVVATSLSAVTALLLTAAVGVLAAAVFAPDGDRVVDRPRGGSRHRSQSDTSLDEMMEKSK